MPHHIIIEKLVAGGCGLGRLPDGLVALVPLVLPGEEVRIAVRRRHKDYLEAEALAIVRPAPERVQPPCPAYGRCGGCDLQHARYEAQLRLKAAVLREHLERSGLSELTEVLEEPLAAPLPFGYRQRIRLQVDEAGRLGFHRPRSHRVEPVAGCLLARPELNAVWSEIEKRAAWRELPLQGKGLEIIASPADRGVVLLLTLQRRPRPRDLQAAREACGGIAGLKGLLLTGDGFEPVEALTGQTGPGSLLACLELPASATGRRPLSLTVEPGGFCQVNPDQNEQLIRTLLAWAAVGPGERVLDLFCGMGNFSLPLALAAGEVVGCDLQGAAIRSARRNAELGGLANCRFFKAPAMEGARQLLERAERFDCLLLDPPRQGCAELLSLLPRFGAGRIIYISCDPATLARDLAILAGLGYRAERIRPVDMFPQTSHLETITLLGRAEPGPCTAPPADRAAGPGGSSPG